MGEALIVRHRCQLVFLRYLNRPKEEEDDNNDDLSQDRSGIHLFPLDSVLPGHKHGHGPDSVCTAEHPESKQAEADLHSPRCYPEQVELPEADMLISSTDQTSPPCSPSNSDFTPSTPSAWEFGDVEFKIKEEEEEEEDKDN